MLYNCRGTYLLRLILLLSCSVLPGLWYFPLARVVTQEKGVRFNGGSGTFLVDYVKWHISVPLFYIQ